MKLHLTVSIPNWLDRICTWPVLWYRKHKFGQPYRKIRLTEGKITIVDPDVFYRLNNFQWCAAGRDQSFYAVRFLNNANKGIRLISMHRELMNFPVGLFVDHHNGDSLDNRITNLRIATRSQNLCNRRKTSSKTSSRFRGVTFRKNVGKWAARIRYLGKEIWLGLFDSEIDAAKAYDEAAKKYHGEFARLNLCG
jgi:hypothetical protein